MKVRESGMPEEHVWEDFRMIGSERSEEIW